MWEGTWPFICILRLGKCLVIISYVRCNFVLHICDIIILRRALFLINESIISQFIGTFFFLCYVCGFIFSLQKLVCLHAHISRLPGSITLSSQMISKGIYPVVYLIFETSFYQMFLHFMENGFGLNLAIPHCKWALFPALVNIIKIAASHSCPHSTYPSLSLFLWRPKAESGLQFPVSAIVSHSVTGRLSMNSPTFLWPVVFIRTMAPIRETEFI